MPFLRQTHKENGSHVLMLLFSLQKQQTSAADGTASSLHVQNEAALRKDELGLLQKVESGIVQHIWCLMNHFAG